jgi:ankyrin repeat and MYND domain-containing protein 2
VPFPPKENVDEAKELVRSGKVRINCLDNNGMSPLDQACFKGNEDLVEFFLGHGADADNRAHEQGYTALMFAALAGSLFY